MSSALCRGYASIFNVVLKPLQITQSRTALTNHYINKKKRMIKHSRSPKNLEWTKHLDAFEKSEESKEPEHPHMIHLITLTKTLKGRPWWERDILREFGFDSKHPKINEKRLAKNTAKVNKLLKEVLHLVDIQPFKLPPNLPTNLSNSTHLVLCSNGEMVMGNVEALDNSLSQEESHFKIDSLSANECTETDGSKVDEDTLAKEENSIRKGTPTENFGTFKMFSEFSKWDLSREVVQKQMDRTIQLNRLNMDQFPTHYEYKHNQDGKMHRYNFNKHLVNDDDS